MTAPENSDGAENGTERACEIVAVMVSPVRTFIIRSSAVNKSRVQLVALDLCPLTAI